MKVNLRSLTVLSLIFGALTLTAPPSAQAQNSSYYMWCVMLDYRQPATYYSSVFLSSNEASYGHDVPFANFVESRYGSYGMHAQCYTDDSQSHAQYAKSQDMYGNQGSYTVVDTGWSP